jgi:putative peptidoglycan lipid II flippase
MLRKILSVGGWTLLSRVAGFVRDIALAAVLGAGQAADAFVVAQRIPNHFRAIFGEGAFNAAFIPTYAGLLESEGDRAAKGFADRIFTLLLLSQVALLALAMLGMPWIVRTLAPGFADDPVRFDLAVTLTRITFPVPPLHRAGDAALGVLNAHDRFAAAAAAPILLNLSILAALASPTCSPTAGHAAAWGVTVAGRPRVRPALRGRAARRADGGPRPAARGCGLKRFFKTLGPALVGSAGVQIATFADTILASLLPTGAPAALYYADRLNQLPIGVVAVAAGTVLLPTMSRRIAAGDVGGAHAAQNRVAGLTLALAMPPAIAFLVMPDLLIQALFGRGAFDAAAVARAADVLAAYAVGLPAVLLINCVRASFYARSDTATPVKAALAGIGVNVVLKVVLTPHYDVAGLALATSIGIWVNLIILAVLARRRDWTAPDARLARTLAAVLLASAALAALALLARAPLAGVAAAWSPAWWDEALLGMLGLAGIALYGSVLLATARVLGIRSCARERESTNTLRQAGNFNH